MEYQPSNSSTTDRLIELKDEILDVDEIKDILEDKKSKTIFNKLKKRGIKNVSLFISKFVEMSNPSSLAS